MTSSTGARVFASQAEACAWHVDQLPADCQSASLLDLAALWRSRASLLSGFNGETVQLTTRVDAHAAPGLTAALAQLGCGGRVRARDDLTAAISSGLTGPNLLLDNPCKTRSLINLAKRSGVAMTTFDTESEAARLAEQWPNVAALLLVRPDGSSKLGGASLGVEADSVVGILAAARRFGLNVAGVAIADAEDAELQAPDLLEAARLAITVGRLLGHRMSLLDVGPVAFQSFELDGRDDLSKFVAANKIKVLLDSTDALLTRSVVVATRVVAKQPDVVNGGWRCTIGDSTFGAFSGWRLRVGELAGSPELLGIVRASVAIDNDADLPAEEAADTGDVVRLIGLTGSLDDQLGCLCQQLPLSSGDWLLWSGVGADSSRSGRLANGLAEPAFRCFLQSGREPVAPIGIGSTSVRSSSFIRCCRTRHSSSCCYTETVSVNAAASVVANSSDLLLSSAIVD